MFDYRPLVLLALALLLGACSTVPHITAPATETRDLQNSAGGTDRVEVKIRAAYYIAGYPFGVGPSEIYRTNDRIGLAERPLVSALVFEIIHPPSLEGRILTMHDDGPPDSVVAAFPSGRTFTLSVERTEIGTFDFRRCTSTLAGGSAVHR